jgi:hypothetical protein
MGRKIIREKMMEKSDFETEKYYFDPEKYYFDNDDHCYMCGKRGPRKSFHLTFSTGVLVCDECNTEDKKCEIGETNVKF